MTIKKKTKALMRWLRQNEYILAALPANTQQNRHFWLYWLEWHLKFYLSAVRFVLVFSDSFETDLYVLCENSNALKMQAKNFSMKKISLHILATCCNLPKCTPAEFEESIISSPEAASVTELAATTDRPEYIRMNIGHLTLYTSRTNANLAATLAIGLLPIGHDVPAQWEIACKPEESKYCRIFNLRASEREATGTEKIETVTQRQT